MVENVTPAAAWDALRHEVHAQLCDVRTEAEWAFVGVPDLGAVGKQTVLIPWQIYPSMQFNGEFVEQLRTAGLSPDDHVYFICRSGARSLAAAQAAADAGFRHCYNVAEGFEGPVDRHGHRGCVSGWKASQLPWRQR